MARVEDRKVGTPINIRAVHCLLSYSYFRFRNLAASRIILHSFGGCVFLESVGNSSGSTFSFLPVCVPLSISLLLLSIHGPCYPSQR